MRPKRTLTGRNARVLAFVFATALGGCGTAQTDSKAAQSAARPESRPVRAVTDFSDALRCMDGLLARHGVRDLIVTAQGIPDQTGRVAAGTKDMLITAISKMAATSRAIRFVAYGSDLADIVDLQNAHGGNRTFEVPDFFIRGAITQLDENVIQQKGDISVNFPLTQFGINRDQVVSLLSLDLNVGRVKDLQILPGVGTSNALAVVRRDVGGKVGSEIGGLIRTAGISFEINFGRSEGMHQGVRTLVELGVVESFGQLARVPYWECLGIDSSNPAVQRQLRDWQAAPERNDIQEARVARSETRPQEKPVGAPPPQEPPKSLVDEIAKRLGLSFHPSDRIEAEAALRTLLGSEEPGTRRPWRGGATGRTGLVAFVDVENWRDGRACKSIDFSTRMGRDVAAGSFLACPVRMGGWEIVSGRRKQVPSQDRLRDAAAPAQSGQPPADRPAAQEGDRPAESNPTPAGTWVPLFK